PRCLRSCSCRCARRCFRLPPWPLSVACLRLIPTTVSIWTFCQPASSTTDITDDTDRPHLVLIRVHPSYPWLKSESLGGGDISWYARRDSFCPRSGLARHPRRSAAPGSWLEARRCGETAWSGRQKLLRRFTPADQLVCPAGFEPTTVRLEGGCSIQLSYGHTVAVGQSASGRHRHRQGQRRGRKR